MIPRKLELTPALRTAIPTLTVLAILCGSGSPQALAESPADHHISVWVDDDAAPGGDGSAENPYDNLADALASANAISAAVVIRVAPGDYAIDDPLVIDRSLLELRGSSVLIEDRRGWATGALSAGTATRIIGTEVLGANPLVAVGRVDEVVIEAVAIRGLVLVPAEGGNGIVLTRVQGYSVRDNVVGAPAYIGLVSTASSGLVEGNHISGVAIGAVLEGGYPASPSVVGFRWNRSVGNFTGGLLLAGSSSVLSDGDQLEADVRHNDLSDNNAAGLSFGARVLLFGPETPLTETHVQALLQGNRLVGNKIGMVIDSGFPYRGADESCDPRVFTGSIDLQLKNNQLRNSLLAPALVTFTRREATLIPETLPEWQYLHRATIAITDRQGLLANALIDHPRKDPFLGSCPRDAGAELLGNALRYNGLAMPNGRHF